MLGRPVVLDMAENIGLRVAIDAMARCRAAAIPARLTVVGEGKERARFEEQARRLGLDDSTIRFVGRLPPRGNRINEPADHEKELHAEIPMERHAARDREDAVIVSDRRSRYV